MRKRFSDQELYELRNFIPINKLIEHLMIPSKISEGYFRFLCPSCHEFQTAVNPKTNLARCFNCERNFNTIDITRIVRNPDFIESVKFLKVCLASFRSRQKDKTDTSSLKLKRMLSIGEILQQCNIPSPTLEK